MVGAQIGKIDPILPSSAITVPVAVLISKGHLIFLSMGQGQGQGQGQGEGQCRAQQDWLAQRAQWAIKTTLITT